jgi:hypothetical protein
MYDNLMNEYLSSIILLPLLLSTCSTLLNLLPVTLTDFTIIHSNTTNPAVRHESFDCPLHRDHSLTLLECLRARKETEGEDLLALVDYLLPALLLAQQDQLRRRTQQVRV